MGTEAQQACACGASVLAKGMCRRCYNRARRISLPPCHCGGASVALGLCETHYRKLRESVNPKLKTDRKLRERIRRKRRYSEGHRPRHGDPISRRYRELKRDSLKRGKDMTLTREHFGFLASKACFYCGGPPPNHCGGLDRIDNRLGYIPGNVIPSCGVCNSIRGSFLSVYETRKVVALIMDWRGTSGNSPFLGCRHGRKKKDA